MDKRKMEYVILAVAVIILIYGSYFFITYHYNENELAFDSITLLSPSSSKYSVNGNTIEFRNSLYDIYNINVQKTNSSDAKIKQVLNHLSSFKGHEVEYFNESCYLVSGPYDDENGFTYHSIIIPIDSFDKDSLSFKNESAVWLYDGNNREFVIDSAYNSRVVL